HTETETEHASITAIYIKRHFANVIRGSGTCGTRSHTHTHRQKHTHTHTNTTAHIHSYTMPNSKTPQSFGMKNRYLFTVRMTEMIHCTHWLLRLCEVNYE